jgi:chaperone modulatory protein CbpM
MAYTLVRVIPAEPRLDLESFARTAGLHPDMVRRLLALGLLDATPDAAGAPWFHPRELRELARIQRLHADLPLDYAACGVVCALLDRIAALEATARRVPHPGGRSWT